MPRLPGPPRYRQIDPALVPVAKATGTAGKAKWSGGLPGIGEEKEGEEWEGGGVKKVKFGRKKFNMKKEQKLGKIKF